MLYQGAVVWKHLDHQNIVPLLGITSTPLQLISKWMANGDLTEYIVTHPDTDRLELVGVPYPILGGALTPSALHKLRGIAKGLQYLHTRHVVHGDLKGVSSSNPHFAAILTPS